ncbi:MAG: type IV pilus assembly protein PilM [Planctomycetes bacterium]|nr:type IV pilus assembly protein PilM [Planctomycetota bacterium]
MATTQAVWGIDVGRCSFKAIKLRSSSDGKVELVDYEHFDHAKILTQPDADRPALIAAALEKFLSRHDITKDAVVISVPGQHTLARFTKLPPVAPKRIPDIVRYEADQQIPFDMDEVIWDYQTFQREGLPDIEVGIFAMKRELIREHLLHFEQASIEPIGVQSGPLADYNAAHFDGLLTSDTMILIDIGAENTDLVVATPDSLWTRTIPMGGNTFTEALVKSFKLSFAKSEALKRTAAESKYARQVFQAMRPIFADLVQELQRSIGFYASTHREAKVERLVGFGNAFQLPGLQKYLQQNLGMAVEQPETFKNCAPSPLMEQDNFKQNFLSFAVAYGLALQGLDVAKVNSNLLPTEIAKQVVWQKKRPAFAAAAACLVLAGGSVWFRYMSDKSALAASSVNWSPPPGFTEASAASIIEKGPDQSWSDRARANAVLLSGNALNKELAKLSGQGGKERAETEKMVALEKQKTIMPKFVSIIHEALPIQEGVAQAKTQAEIAAVQKAIPTRSQRRNVAIEILDIRFEPDLRLFKWESQIEVKPPINSYENKAGSKELPGLLAKITCTTPNEGGSKFIRDEFMYRLRDLGRQPDLGFYVDNIMLANGSQIGGGSRGGARTTGRAPVGTEKTNLDPVTEEPMDDDWKFEIWTSVILADFPGEEAAAKAETAPKGKAEQGGAAGGKPAPAPAPTPAPTGGGKGKKGKDKP